MNHKLLLNFHIFSQVKILDLRLIAEGLDAQEEKEHIKVDHPQNVDISCSTQLALKLLWIVDLLVVASRHDCRLEKPYFLKCVHIVNWLIVYLFH